MLLENEKKPSSHQAMPDGRTGQREEEKPREKEGREETREQPGVGRESSAKSYPT